MDNERNRYILGMVRDITVAKMSNTTVSPDQEGGKGVADFMQEIYDKLTELYNSN